MTKHVNLRLPDDVHALAVAAASADDRSLNSWLISVVRRAAEPAQESSAEPQPKPGSERS